MLESTVRKHLTRSEFILAQNLTNFERILQVLLVPAEHALLFTPFHCIIPKV